MSDAKISFSDFIAKLPDAPSADAPRHTPDPEAPADEAEAPLATEAAEPEAPRKPRVRRASDDHDAPQPTSAKTPSPGAPPGEVTPEVLRAALAAGDLDTLGELLGEDPALYDERTPKWAARQRKEHKLKSERDSVVQKAEAVVGRWAPVLNLVERIDAGEVQLVPELLRTLTNRDPDGLWMAAVRARASTDPRIPALTETTQRQAARVAELEAERVARVDAAFYETLRDEVATDSVVRKIDGWEAKVAEVLRESVDPDLGEPKLSVRQAADRVVRREREEFDRRAAVFGEAPSTKKRTRAATPERASGASGAKVRKLSREEWLAARNNG